MPSPTIPASAPRAAVFRARRNLDTSKLAQLNIDDDTIRRLRIRTAKFPTSFSAGDQSVLAEVRSKSAYYSVIARAVSKLPHNTRDARLALYDRAEIALTAELLQDLEISDEQAAVQRLALERAIRKIEGDVWKKEKPKQSAEKHPRPFTSFLSFFQLFKRQI
jgi:plasmid stability protein